MKKLLLLLTLVFTININAQDDKTVTLVVSGQGKTKDEAQQKALRSAIEQAFGTFISSKTEILNDNLVKDEIVSVTNGNIQKFEPVSEVQLPDGSYASTLKATVSVSKLTSFCEGKGITVEFKGGLFAMNIKMQKLNEENEINAIRLLCNTSKIIVDKMFDYNISSNEPKSVDGNSNEWEIILTVGLKLNSNFKMLKEYLTKSLYEIAMDSADINNYQSLNLNVFPVELKTSSITNVIFFRKEQSLALLQDLTWYIDFAQANFFVKDGITESSLYEGTNEINNMHKEIIKFKLDRKLETNWVIHSDCNKQQYFHQEDFGGPCWGSSYSYCSNHPQNCFNNYGYTYELTKVNINKLRKSIVDRRASYDQDIKRWKESPRRYSVSHIEDHESSIKQCNDQLAKFADSTTVFIYTNEGHPYLGYPDYFKKEGKICFKIYLNPTSDEFAKYLIKKHYITDELGKITNFSVKPGKLEDLKNQDLQYLFQKSIPDSIAISREIENLLKSNLILSKEKIKSWATTLISFRHYYKYKQKEKLLPMATNELICLYCKNNGDSEFYQFLDYLFTNNDLYLKYDNVLNKNFKYLKNDYAEFFCSGDCDHGEILFFYDNFSKKWLFKGVVETDR